PPISDNNQISTTNSSQNLQVVDETSSSSNANTISENKPNNQWSSSEVRMLIDEVRR
ncbi:4966_t:CDS:2, partial [Gigaspora margarita]